MMQLETDDGTIDVDCGWNFTGHNTRLTTVNLSLAFEYTLELFYVDRLVCVRVAKGGG